jgi:hypothetical protein
MILIDNSVLSFAFQLDNGIPILPYYDNKKDDEFRFLTNYLSYLCKFEDIRIENKKNIKLDYLTNISSPRKKMQSPRYHKDSDSTEEDVITIFADDIDFSDELIESTNVMDESCFIKDYFIEILEELKSCFN